MGAGNRKLLSQGFTLLEILVALMIFAIIGVISAQLMSQTVNANEKLSDRGARLNEIHRAMQVVQRDLLQLTPRPVRGGYGDVLPALIIGTDGAIEFTRNGWRNPLSLPRAEVQRVGYLLQDEELVRGYWPVLDRAQDTEPAYQVVLKGVTRLEFFALDSAGNEHTFWPTLELPPEIGLVGVIMRIEMEPFGVVQRVWQVPRV
ncbi:MAG: type II secretion system minor pseudopilin GspJ [Pseudomonadota bacterium]